MAPSGPPLTNGNSDTFTARSSLFDLPCELRLLIDFLEHDSRPTFILERSSDVAHRSPFAYCNQACSLPPRDALGWKTLAASLRDKGLHDGGGRKERTILFDGRKWDARTVGDGWRILVEKRGTAVENGLALTDDESLLSVEVDDKLDHYRENGDEDGHDSENEASNCKNASLDWTRHPVPAASPWIEFLLAFGWDVTPLGSMQRWSGRLRNLMYSVMANPDPRLVVWGPSKTLFYNESCTSLFGRLHPSCMAKPLWDGWPDVWPDLEPLVDKAYAGRAAKLEQFPLAMQRNGFLEETYWDFTLLPLMGSHGTAVGVLCELKEATKQVTGERRRASIMRVTEQVGSMDSLDALWDTYLHGLEPAEEDIRFALLYAVEEDSVQEPLATSDYVSTSGSLDVHTPHAFHSKASLKGTVGIGIDNPCFTRSFSLTQEPESGPSILNACLEACKTRKTVVMRTSDGTMPPCLACTAPERGFGDNVRCAIVQPIMSVLEQHEILGILILGLSPRSNYDQEYNLYVNYMAEILQKGAALISLPQEQRRVQKISDDINNALAAQLRMTTLEAERSEARFARMAASAPVGMYLINTDGRPIYVNDAYLDMFGESRESFLQNSRTVVDLTKKLLPEDVDAFREAWRKVVEEKTPSTLEFRLNKPWGSVDKATGKKIEGQTWLLANTFPDIELDGRVTSVQGWLTDISHQKFSERLLSQKLQDAIENKRQTENFIDMTSHEMRNPLSAILQSADSIVSTLEMNGMPELDEEMVVSQETAEELVDAAQTIILCAQHQKRIVDDILTLSKLDASLLVISPDRIQAPTLITKALKMYEAEISRAGIHASLEIEQSYADLEIDWVILDASRLLQVVINLVTNAIKFTQYSERKSIVVHLGASVEKPTGKHHNIDFIPHRHARPPTNPLDEWHQYQDIYMQIAVSDSGRGLSDEEMKLLFQRFSQASPKTYKQYGGSGLGLFISRELCELQGGQIGVRSGEGETTFTFYVRAKKWVPGLEIEESDSPQSKGSSRPQPQRFVSASNSPMAFNRRGSIVINEPNRGMQSLSRVSSRVSRSGGESPSRGPAAQETLKDLALLSSLASENKRPNLGSQPPSRSSTWPQAPVEEEKPGSPGAHLHVLIVEDNLINQKVMSQQLRKQGCTVHVANHGLECLEFLETSAFCSAETPLSVILLDLEMPTMDGLTCIRHIRERQSDGRITGHIPVSARNQGTEGRDTRVRVVFADSVGCTGHRRHCQCTLRADPRRHRGGYGLGSHQANPGV
ncbi:hypothetical protein K431DRAFT_284702 [Polychaeton citri CBS 116435]|uniref:Histidine kinase n=1 Tax=Polychaeton citri CBS 116435 TaxID=1314669 RepID=A0A9P4QB34_9PEZI|nr:hypothetical protein K431DRAFT_284702 [Polychaeton citri CBS 116435]